MTLILSAWLWVFAVKDTVLCPPIPKPDPRLGPKMCLCAVRCVTVRQYDIRSTSGGRWCMRDTIAWGPSKW